MQSASEAWKRAVSSGGGVIWLVEIKSGSTTWKAVTGGRPFDGDDGRYPPTIDRVTGAGSRLDPLTRASSVNGITVVGLDDRSSGVSSQGWLRGILANNECKGARVRIWLGHHDLAESDFLIQGTYMIDDWIPAPGVIELRCLGPVGVPLDVNVSGGWQMQHPLDIANDILVHKCQIPTELYADGDISADDHESHWSVSRADINLSAWGHENAIKENEAIPAYKLLEEIAFLTGGAILARESGVIEYVDYDKTAASSRTWNVNESEWQIIETKRTVINQVNFAVANVSEHGATQFSQYPVKFEDATSKTTYRYPGSTRDRLFTKGLSSPWLNGLGWLSNDPGITGTDIAVSMAVWHGFCGTRVIPGMAKAVYGSGNSILYQDANARLNGTTRTSYLLLTNWNTRGRGFHRADVEIVKATAWRAFTSDEANYLTTPYYRQYWSTVLDRQTGTSSAAQAARFKLAPDGGMFTVDRAQDNTQAFDWGSSGGPPVTQAGAAMNINQRGPYRPLGVTVPVYDITIAREVALRLLERAGNGLPRLRVRRPLRDADVQIADTISITGGEDLFVINGQDGISVTDTWEVTGKGVYLAEGFCEFELALKVNAPVTALSVDPDPDGIPGGTVSINSGPIISVDGFTVVNELGSTIMRGD